MRQWSTFEKRHEPAWQMVEEIAQSPCCGTARNRSRKLSGPICQKPTAKVPSDQAASKKASASLTEAALAELREDQGHVLVFSRKSTTRSQRTIERLFDKTQDFCVVGKLESRIDVGFEGKLSQEPEAKCVDRRDRD